ncbi:MAG: A/G-specific adenine glycosylase [Lachnospiraceae bacterium]|nr:A/G-specific adenine glycosylase [Lachnospiraceae bacterium]MCI9471023.1 A/G-specific adenine glycosylase [Lachnospiraceae bacterium]
MERLREIEKPLLKWYRQNKRALPWRVEKDPYEIWISEIMCQQTRVEVVKDYFERFLEALPTVRDLAECPEERLMKLWEGLGYYNRVRNMQKAAQQVMGLYGGQLPADYEALKGLKGIGDYTAGAIAAIAYGIPVPAVDGNVLRVVSRVLESREDIVRQSVRRQIGQKIQAVMPTDCPGDYDQALMELGALICLPGAQAKCGQCPLKGICLAAAHGTAAKLPVKTRSKPRRIEERTVLVIQDGDCVAIRKRAAKGLLAGLYELPNVKGHLKEEETLSWVREMGLGPLRIRPLGEAKHIFSHVEWRMRGYQIRVQQLDERRQGDMIFARAEEVQEKYAIPSAFDAFIRKG